jgi:hypothetical protein
MEIVPSWLRLLSGILLVGMPLVAARACFAAERRGWRGCSAQAGGPSNESDATVREAGRITVAVGARALSEHAPACNRAVGS